MSRQSSLDTYFKSNKCIVTPTLPKSIMDSGGDTVARKRSLSLKKPENPEILSTPPKLIKEEIKSESPVIDLCSDDESSPHNSTAPFSTPTKVFSANGDSRNRNRRLNFDSPSVTPTTSHTQPSVTTPMKDDGHESDSSEKTIIYSPPTTPQTPRRTPAPPSSSFRSPSSGKKYFSPIKKRAVSAKKPVVRNLARNLADCLDNNELFDKACLGMDDKTIFLLTIINKCYCNPSLYQLMDEASQSLLLKCMQSIKPGMRLVCRLYWHQDRWYKLDKVRTLLSKDNETVDEPTLHDALRFLQENELITLGGSDGNLISFDDLTTILSANELKQICKELKLKINSKQGAIAALKSYCREKSLVNYYTPSTNNNSNRVLKIMSLKAGPCYKLSDLARKTIYELHILMYLGIDYNVIREKNLELTLLNYKINREVYPIEEAMLDDASVVFKDRQEFRRYVDAHNVYEKYLIETDLNKKCEIVTNTYENFNNITDSEMKRYKSLPVWLRRFTPMNIYIKILETGIQDLKKENRFGIALDILQALISQDTCRRHKRADWYAEKALILHKCSESEEAAKVLLEGFKSDIADQAKDIMRPRAKTLAKQKGLGIEESIKAELLEYANKEEILEKNLRGVHVYKQPMDRTKSKGKLKFETRKSDERIIQDVEEYCLSHYINTGEFTDGMHWEGRIVTTIFFLLFWDIIYWKPHDCPGVFMTLFQKFPLDLFCESFYSNRKDLIEARLALVERSSSEEVSETIITNWIARPENELSGISRSGMRAEQVAGAARALGGRALAALCRRLATDYRHAHSGFPDLTLWNTRTNKIRFVEVKSDTDKPSMKQIQWMHYLQQHGIDTEFCYVGVNTTRCKARSVS